MNIQEYISKDCVTFQLQADKKEAALKEMAELLYQAGKVKNLSLYLKAVEERELEYTTGIGGGIAIPHGKSATVPHACIAFGKSETGIALNSLDEKPVYCVFMLAIPEHEDETHLDMLSTLARKLMHQEVQEALLQANDIDTFYQAIE